MKLSKVRDILHAKVLVGADWPDKMIVGGGSADLMSDVLATAAEDTVLLTGLISEQVFRTAKIVGVGAVVFVRGKQPMPSVLQLAEKLEIPVMSTQDTLFVASGKLYMNGLRGLNGSW